MSTGPSAPAASLPRRGAPSTAGTARRPRTRLIAWLAATICLFVVAEIVGSRQIPSPDAAAVAAISLRVAALLATLAGVAGYVRETREGEAHSRHLASAQRAHEAAGALAAIEHAARALPPASSPLPLADAIVSEVAVIRRLIERDSGETHTYHVADALLGPVTASRLSGTVVDVELEDDLRGRGDPAAFGQVVQALLQNARRHAPGAAVTVRGCRVDDFVSVTIEDEGPGVAPELSERLFELGVRSVAGGGSGLGLAAAAQVADEQGGRLSLLQSPIGGAAFLLEVPAAAAAVVVR